MSFPNPTTLKRVVPPTKIWPEPDLMKNRRFPCNIMPTYWAPLPRWRLMVVWKFFPSGKSCPDRCQYNFFPWSFGKSWNLKDRKICLKLLYYFVLIHWLYLVDQAAPWIEIGQAVLSPNTVIKKKKSATNLGFMTQGRCAWAMPVTMATRNTSRTNLPAMF